MVTKNPNQFEAICEAARFLDDRPVVPLSPCDDWESIVINRITTPGTLAEITEEMYDHFVDVLPPIWMGGGGLFAFAEGAEPLRLFFRREGRYYCRQLDWEETATFSVAVGLRKAREATDGGR